jgi:transposase
MQINKSDRNDAVGIARIMQCGWYKEVRVKDLDSHAIKSPACQPSSACQDQAGY